MKPHLFFSLTLWEVEPHSVVFSVVFFEPQVEIEQFVVSCQNWFARDALDPLDSADPGGARSRDSWRRSPHPFAGSLFEVLLVKVLLSSWVGLKLTELIAYWLILIVSCSASSEGKPPQAAVAAGEKGFCPFKLDLEPMEESLGRERSQRYELMRSALPKIKEREESILNEITSWDSMNCAREFVEAVRCYEEHIHESMCVNEGLKLHQCVNKVWWRCLE